jgi:ribosomal protein S11
MATKKSTAKKKKSIKLAYGLLHVQTSPNNTIVTLTDENGNKVLGGGTGLV